MSLEWELHLQKLGQFLATRPDIIGKELANDLENYKISCHL